MPAGPSPLPDGRCLSGSTNSAPLRVFVPDGANALGLRVCRELGVAPGAHEESLYEDGESSARPLGEVAGCDAYVVQSLYSDPLASVHDKLCRLLFFIRTLKDAGAARVSAVVPYLAYSRQDRQASANGPVMTRYTANLFESCGADLVVTVDVHNLAAFQNAFRCRTLHVEPAALLAGHAAPLAGGGAVTVVAPDAGAIARAGQFRQALSSALDRPIAEAFAAKHRAGKKLGGDLLAGDIEGRQVIIVDDMIGTGATMARTAAACRAMGAQSVDAIATHGLFTAGAQHALAGLVDRLLVTDTLPPFRLEQGCLRDMLRVAPIAPLLAAAIREVHGSGHGSAG